MVVNEALGFLDFLRNVFFKRDRYLLEVVASWVTLIIGIMGSFSQVELAARDAMMVFARIPLPEAFVLGMSVPGLIKGLHYARKPGITHRWTTLLVMLSFVGLCILSVAAGLSNWAFWTLLALLIGFNQGVALIIDLRDLRWACAMLATFFWVSLTAATAQATGWPFPFGVIAFGGWALANLLSVTRLSHKVI